MEILWFLPTFGDGRYLGTATGGRAVTYPYLRQIAEAAEELGYSGALVPTGRSCEDAWITASSLLPVTRRLRFLVAVRPGLTSPSVVARMAATFDRLSNGRLLINVVAGGDPVELAGDGVFLDHDARYDATGEFLTVWRALMAGGEVDFSGWHVQVQGGRLLFPAVQQPYPPLFFGGSSPAAHRVAAEHIDVYITWGEPPEQVAEKIADVRRRAAEYGRTPRFGIRLHVIVRETEREAWDAANQLIRYVDEDTIASAQRMFSRFDSEGQRRMSQLHGWSRASLEVSSNLWAGVGLARGGAATALVGDPDTVAARMREYAELGIDTFVLSGYPHLEEAYRVAELLFPRLPLPVRRAAVQDVALGPFAEIVARHDVPREQEAVPHEEGTILHAAS